MSLMSSYGCRLPADFAPIQHIPFVMKDPTKPDNRRKYEAAFQTEALRRAV